LGKIKILHPQIAFSFTAMDDLLQLWTSIGKHPTTHVLMARQTTQFAVI